MSDKRLDRRSGELTVEMETLRSADIAGRASDQPTNSTRPPREESSLPKFWQVFGATLLSIAALVIITLYNNLTSNLSELRAEMVRMNEAKGEFARKDDVIAVKLLATTHASFRSEIDSLKERATKHRAELDDVRKDAVSRVEHLSKTEALVTEGLRKEVAGVESLKERMTGIAVDLKGLRDDLGKMRVDVDRNQVADLERRDRRDSQMKQIDETVKELAKTVQETREKLARLEGQTKPTDVGPPRPMKTSAGTPPEKD